MSEAQQINHKGTILSINEGHIEVGIVNISACAGCHAKGACSMSDMKEKSIDIYTSNNNFSINEEVLIKTQESLGWLAMFLAYVLPFIIIIASLFITSIYTSNELVIGLVSLGLLFPYFGTIALFKEKFKKTFSFTIHKIV